jgi:hypothetical protein
MVRVRPPSEGAVFFSAASNDGGDYSFRLTRSAEAGSYQLTVKSKVGVSVESLPVTYVAGAGWSGTRRDVTGKVFPIEGRNWSGWRIEILPTAPTATQSHLAADLTRRK